MMSTHGRYIICVVQGVWKDSIPPGACTYKDVQLDASPDMSYVTPGRAACGSNVHDPLSEPGDYR